jgi:hypothetical protein
MKPTTVKRIYQSYVEFIIGRNIVARRKTTLGFHITVTSLEVLGLEETESLPQKFSQEAVL